MSIAFDVGKNVDMWKSAKTSAACKVVRSVSNKDWNRVQNATLGVAIRDVRDLVRAFVRDWEQLHEQ